VSTNPRKSVTLSDLRYRFPKPEDRIMSQEIKLTVLFSGESVIEIAENYDRHLTEVRRQLPVIQKAELYDHINRVTLGVWSELPTLDQICLAINKERVERDRNAIEDRSIDVRVRALIFENTLSPTLPGFPHRLLIY
jgi:hypothetical protein